ncbi:bone morphogenetic protein receptor type-2-like isoform 2-T4 [Pholidichthys leucotaenia]
MSAVWSGSNMALLTVFLCGFLLFPAICGFQSDDREFQLCAYADSLHGAETASSSELVGVVQENGTIRCGGGSRCYGLWEKRADGGMYLLNQGCWTHVGNQQECRGDHCVLVTATPSSLQDASYRFCCCSRDLCNANYSEAPLTDDDPALRPIKPDGQEDSHADHQLTPEETVLIALVTVAIAAIIIVALFLGYRMVKRKQKHSLSAVDVMEATNGESAVDLDSLKLLELIGRGRYGSVFRGSLNERRVAVKVFSSANRQNFANERSIYGLLLLQQHDNVARFLTADEKTASDGRPEFIIVMEFYPHGCLSQYLSLNTVDWLTCCRMTHGLTRGLAFLHSEICIGDIYKPAVAHRDLTSRNILVRADLSCVLADFGLSMRLTGSRPCRHGDDDTMTISEVGTVRYMAPEVLGGALNLRDCESALKQVDVYALGLLYWESFKRCSDLFPGEPVPEFQLAFQAELGNHPSFEDMQVMVVREKHRPRFPEAWKENSLVLRSLKETMEDCWDQDAEARLTAQCAEQRLYELTLLSVHTAINNHRNLSHSRWAPQPGPAPSFIEEVGVVKNLQRDGHPAEVIRTTAGGGDVAEKNRNCVSSKRQQVQVSRVSTTTTLIPASTLATLSESQQSGGAVVPSSPVCGALTEEDLQTTKLDPEQVDKNLRESSDENLMERSQKHFTSAETRGSNLRLHHLHCPQKVTSTHQTGPQVSGGASCLHPLPKQQNLPQRPTSLHLTPKPPKETGPGSSRLKLGRLKSTHPQVETGVAKMNTVAVIAAAEPHLVNTVTKMRSDVMMGKEVNAGVPTLVTNDLIGGGRTNPAGPQVEEEVKMGVGRRRSEGETLLNFSPDEHEPLLRREQLPAENDPPPPHYHCGVGRGSNSNNNNNRLATDPGPTAPLQVQAPPTTHLKTTGSDGGKDLGSGLTKPLQAPEVPKTSSTEAPNLDSMIQKPSSLLQALEPEIQSSGPSLQTPDPGASILDSEVQSSGLRASPLETSTPQTAAVTSQHPEPRHLGETWSPACNPQRQTQTQTQVGQTKTRRPERPSSLDLSSSCTNSDDISVMDDGSLSASGEKIKRRVKTPYTLKKWRPASWVVSTDTELDPDFDFSTGSSSNPANFSSVPQINQSKSSMAVFLMGSGTTATTTSEPDGMTSF